MSEIVKPYQDSRKSKKNQVADMFDSISHRYDFLNHFLSLGIDKIWRKKAIALFKERAPKVILDVATGTADFSIEALVLNPDKIIGVDISEGMLKKGREKVEKKGLDSLIELKYGDSEDLPFKDETFEAVMVGFGVRNFENLEKGLNEIKRVMKTDGMFAILEFSRPKKFPIKQSFSFYSKYIIPFIGKRFSKDKSAYTYLPESVKAFPEGNEFKAVLSKIGFNKIKIMPLSGGIATIYYGIK